MAAAPRFTVTNEGFEIGVPVRVTWTDWDDEHHRPLREHIAARGLPGHRIVRDGVSDYPGRAGQHFTEHTGVVVPLRAWEQPIGGFDEGSWPYVTVRPATESEARDLLADEERTESIRRLVCRFKDVTGNLNLARDWAEPDLSHVDISDVPLDEYVEEYRDHRAREIRGHRHIRDALDGYQLAIPGRDNHSPDVVYPDPERGTVWYESHTFNQLVPYRYQGELAHVVDELTPLLRLDIPPYKPRTMTRDEVAELWGIDPESVRSTMRRHKVEPVSRTISGQAEYVRARVLNAHRYDRLGYGSWRNRRRATETSPTSDTSGEQP